ncbi:MAG: hypothetical protein HQ522_07240 [Bacteroidetes bacterium]|nr:hypothetical protein [Bacteroidota bacterium]
MRVWERTGNSWADQSAAGIDFWKQKTAHMNWKTIGIGVVAAGGGVVTVIGGVAAGTAATAATGGIGLAPAVIGAGSTVTAGITLFAIGMGDIAGGISGQESILVSTAKAIYNTPPEATAVNPF